MRWLGTHCNEAGEHLGENHGRLRWKLEISIWRPGDVRKSRAHAQCESGRKRVQTGSAVQTVRPESGCLRGSPVGTSGGELAYR